jgi:hypothetical protein
MRTSFFDGILHRVGVRIALIAVSVVLSLVAAGLRTLPQLHRAPAPVRVAAVTHAPVVHVAPTRAVAPVLIGPPAPARVVIGPMAPAMEPASSGVRTAVAVASPVTSAPLVHGAAPVKAGSPVATGGPAAPTVLQAKAASLSPSPIVMAPVTVNATRLPAPAAPAAAASPTPAPAPAPPNAGHLDERLTYQYDALGRRDPFQPLVGGGFVGADVGGDAPPDVGGIKVVGIVWGAEDQFAMVEDARGQSMVLRVGDKVQNGVVTGLKRDALIVAITVEGQTQTVTVPLTKKGDQSNANR